MGVQTDESLARQSALKRMSVRMTGFVQKISSKKPNVEKRLSEISSLGDEDEKLDESNALDSRGLAVVSQIATILTDRTKSESRMNVDDPFSRTKVPAVTLEVYIARLARYVNIWRGHAGGIESAGVRSAVLALIYIDRLQESCQEYAVNEHNIHRLVMVGFLVATKFEEDRPIGNDFWSKVGGVQMAEVNRLESAFCNLLGFRFFVEPDDYDMVLETVSMPQY